MFVWSFRMSKREIIIFAVGLLVFIIAVCLLLSNGSASVSAEPVRQYTNEASNRYERLAFIRQFGWTVENEPVEVKELVIPTEFGDVYENYNAIQLSQGYDLSKLRGETVKLWTYRVTNYPGCGNVYANVIIKDGKVVGGDISSTELGGFMHGFDPGLEDSMAAMARVSGQLPDRSVPEGIPAQTDAPPEPADLA